MSQTAGVKPMAIAGRVARERERCIGMSNAEREWRKQWIKDQILKSSEPSAEAIENYWAARTNIIRRIYRWPLDTLFKALQGPLGVSRANDYRYITGKLGLIALGVLSITYYFKYNGNDWTKKGGWRVMRTKPMVLPGMDAFPYETGKKPHEYASRGFQDSYVTTLKK